MKETTIELKEAHNRQIQDDINSERDAITALKTKRNDFSPRIQNLEWELENINTEVRKLEIDMECREKRIKVLSTRFWN